MFGDVCVLKKGFCIPFILFFAISISGCSKISLENISDSENQQEAAEKNTYILPSDTTIITELDLSKLNETELKYAYEEIFARHGKIYDDINFSKYFNSQDWYTPDPSYSESTLSDMELENSKYIASYISEHFSETTETTTLSQNNTASNKDNTTIIVARDNPYYYEHYSDDNTFIIPDSSVRKLTKSELSSFSSDTLALIRNEIYARNGYVFKKEKYKDYFESKLWYVPNPDFNESFLNETEKYNIQLIKSME